jgi:hypothetical protein
VQAFAGFGSGVVYRGASLGDPPDLTPVRADIAAVVRHWATERLAVGSHDALVIDY